MPTEGITARIVALVMAAAVASAGGCSAGDPPAERGDCPVEPISVVVTVNPWSDIVDRLGGDCVAVTTIVSGSAVDPHDFEPSPVDSARLERADLIVMNGGGYDHWAHLVLTALSDDPPVIDAHEVASEADVSGADPHLWYSPGAVTAMSAAIGSRLQSLLPPAAPYLDARSGEWRRQLDGYLTHVTELRELAHGRRYLATESVFDRMAEALGLDDATPDGYRRSVRNGSEPSPGDLAALLATLAEDPPAFVVVNPQVEGSTTRQVRRAAGQAGVPVVGISETQPGSDPGFVAWQIRQLDAVGRTLRD